MCRRLDAEEFLCLLAWSGRQTAAVLEGFADRIIDADFSVFEGDTDSQFPNGRQVVLVIIQGDRGG
jgi:hypothetical protein